MSRKDDLRCDDCGNQLEKNDFIAIIGKTPSTGLSMPVGRTDSVLKKIGLFRASVFPCLCDKGFRQFRHLNAY